MSTIYNPSSAFQEAAQYLSSASALSSTSNTIKLELYAIFKYLTVSSSPNTPRPSLLDFTGKAKWDAWKSAGEAYKGRPADAEARYLEIARSLGWVEGKEIAPIQSKAAEAHDDANEPADEEDDIWDKDEDIGARKRRGDGGAMGPVMSTMSAGDEENSSVLSNLAIAGDVQSLVAYLEAHPEAVVDAPDENGYTPLHLAADRGHLAVVKALLERGAHKDIKDEDDLTAKELAEIAGHTEIVDLLSNAQNVPI
ncbi:ankyrin repeat-containing domain protein [Dichomitus squalens]|uniref:Ankyrin repeat-containing domain protein n=1 Tax=Dichomitus squalens TaxID=114155 RepID=A0A4Q9N5S5_9APHY|nr:ankyrin repeat-containing domain protein [Dichomitus squalens]